MSEAEVYANLELDKIVKWAKDNKTEFNDSKSKAMLVTRKRTIEKCQYISKQ